MTALQTKLFHENSGLSNKKPSIIKEIPGISLLTSNNDLHKQKGAKKSQNQMNKKMEQIVTSPVNNNQFDINESPSLLAENNAKPLNRLKDEMNDADDDDDTTRHKLPAINCNLCENQFVSYVEYHRHKLNSECSEDSNKCDVCYQKFETLNKLKIHFSNHSTERGYRCHICTVGDFGSTLHQLDHMRIHSDTKHFICDICGEVFRKALELQKHCELKHENVNLISPYRIIPPCDMNSSTCCDICGMQVKRKLYSRHLSTHEKPYTCGECHQSYGTTHCLKMHMQTHVNSPLKCDICQKVFHWWPSFLKHVESHPPSGDPIKCSLCSRKFNHQFILDYHKKRHHSATSKLKKTYKCSLCQNQFRTIIQMQQHFIKMHNGKQTTKFMFKPSSQVRFSCKPCKETFITNSALKIHMKRKHTVKRTYDCGQCNKMLIGSVQQERKHKASHTEHFTFHPDIDEMYTVQKIKDDDKIKANDDAQEKNNDVLKWEYEAIEFDEEIIEEIIVEDVKEDIDDLFVIDTTSKCILCDEIFGSHEEVESHLVIAHYD